MALTRRRRWILILAALLLVLVAARLAATPIVLKVVRASLDHQPGGYHGDVQDVELRLLRGEVAMLDLTIVKRNGLVPVPFMKVPRFVLAVTWQNFRPYTKLVIVGAHVHFVDAKSKAKQQWGPPFELRELREQLPFELKELRFEDVDVHFHKFEARPQVDVVAHKLNAVWENLNSCLPPGSPSCDSKLSARARLMRGSTLALQGTFARKPVATFVLTARVNDLNPVQLNPALLEYARIDAQGGSIDLSAHYRLVGNAQRLVIVPRLYDVKIAGSTRDGETKLFRELAASAAAGYFERRRGKKAISYESRGEQAGEWKLIDFKPDRLSAR